MNVNKWIEENQISKNHDYAKGWNDLMDFVFKLQCEFDEFEFEVIKSYDMLTPPPSSKIKMPIFIAKSKKYQIIFKESWVLEPDWTVSVERNTKKIVNLRSFVEDINPTNKWLLDGMEKDYIFGPYSVQAKKFTCCVKNKHLLYTLFYLITKYDKESDQDSKYMANKRIDLTEKACG